MTAEALPQNELDVHTTAGKLAELRRRNEEALHPASGAAVEKRHAAGKRTARERVESFLDEGSFVETDALTRHRARDFGMEAKKPTGDGAWINGGFFVCEPKVIDYIDDDATVWEQEPLRALARQGQLSAFRHLGFWQPMDTLRDKIMLNELWDGGDPPWRRWDR